MDFFDLPAQRESFRPYIYTGEVFRVDSGYDHFSDTTVADVIDRESDELGNKIYTNDLLYGLAKKLRAKYAAYWYCFSKRAAEEYLPEDKEEFFECWGEDTEYPEVEDFLVLNGLIVAMNDDGEALIVEGWERKLE